MKPSSGPLFGLWNLVSRVVLLHAMAFVVSLFSSASLFFYAVTHKNARILKILWPIPSFGIYLDAYIYTFLYNIID